MTIMTDLTTVFTAITGGVTTGDIAAMIALVVGAGFGFVMLWFGMRKLTKIFMTALQRGKLKF